MPALTSPLILDAPRSRPGRSVWGTLIAAALAGVSFVVIALVQGSTNAGAPPQAGAAVPATGTNIGTVIEPTPPRVLHASILRPVPSAPVANAPILSPPAIRHPQKHWIMRPVTTPPVPLPSCDGRSNLFPQGNEVGPISAITRRFSDGLPVPLGGEGGVVTETSCGIAALGG